MRKIDEIWVDTEYGIVFRVLSIRPCKRFEEDKYYWITLLVLEVLEQHKIFLPPQSQLKVGDVFEYTEHPKDAWEGIEGMYKLAPME